MSAPIKLYLKVEYSRNIKDTIKFAEDCGYAGIMTNVVNPGFKKEFIDGVLASQQNCFTRSPLILPANSWIYNVIPYIRSPNVGVPDDELRANNEQKFVQELQYAIHLNNCGYIAISLADQDPEMLGVCLKKALSENFEGRIVVELPMVDPRVFSSAHCRDLQEVEGADQWSIWNKFYTATEQSSKVELALVLTSDLPDEEELRRWLGENISMLIIPHSCFISNKNFFPVLSKKHQETVLMFLQYTKCSVVIAPRGINDNRIKNYADCARFYINKLVDWTGLEDTLRYPLQPLYDNLDTSTYETFEQDSSKYVLYQRAIEAAMIDKIPDGEKDSRKLLLMILGAGRGPLVRAALNACANSGRKLKILVVEKNPNAIVTLTSLIEVLWPDKDITLISKDMRQLELAEKADIIVSELLGSFGDNELSPECLDGAQRLLKPDGISIPYDSVSYLRPVMATKAYSWIQTQNSERFRQATAVKKSYALSAEVNWLTYLNSVYYIDRTKELFTFVHPNHEQPIDNSRYKKLEFDAKLDCRLYGFAGYFTSHLYKDINISIHPETHTQGMTSWFPMFFPVQQPVDIKEGEIISIEFWRKVEAGKKVWYEWRHQGGNMSNLNGDNHPIRL